MKAKKLLALILAVMMSVSILGACTKNNDVEGAASPTGSSGNTDKNVGEEIQKDKGTADQITSKTAEVLNVAIPQDIGTFNPWKWKGQGANQALHGIYQPLLHLVDGVYYPGVMKADYVISDDGLTMECELFDNVYDSEGNNLTTDDVIFSIKHSMEVWWYISHLTSATVTTPSISSSSVLCTWLSWIRSPVFS